MEKTWDDNTASRANEALSKSKKERKYHISREATSATIVSAEPKLIYSKSGVTSQFAVTIGPLTTPGVHNNGDLQERHEYANAFSSISSSAVASIFFLENSSIGSPDSIIAREFNGQSLPCTTYQLIIQKVLWHKTVQNKKTNCINRICAKLNKLREAAWLLELPKYDGPIPENT